MKGCIGRRKNKYRNSEVGVVIKEQWGQDGKNGHKTQDDDMDRWSSLRRPEPLSKEVQIYSTWYGTWLVDGVVTKSESLVIEAFSSCHVELVV